MAKGDTSQETGREKNSTPRRRWPERVTAITAIVIAVATVVIAGIAGWAAIFLLEEEEERRNVRIARAWELLWKTEGVTGNFGQIAALESLHADGANLKRLQMRGRYLVGVRLPGADLFRAYFICTDLSGADLSGEANLERAEMQGATLVETDLRTVTLTSADLRSAVLRDADLREADLKEANLYSANLRGAKVSKTDFELALLNKADLTEAVGLTQDQLKVTCAHPALKPVTLDNGFSPPSWSDACERRWGEDPAPEPVECVAGISGVVIVK